MRKSLAYPRSLRAGYVTANLVYRLRFIRFEDSLASRTLTLQSLLRRRNECRLCCGLDCGFCKREYCRATRSPEFKLVFVIRRLRISALAQRDNEACCIPVSGRGDVPHRDVRADIRRLAAAGKADLWRCELAADKRSNSERMREIRLRCAAPNPFCGVSPVTFSEDRRSFGIAFLQHRPEA